MATLPNFLGFALQCVFNDTFRLNKPKQQTWMSSFFFRDSTATAEQGRLQKILLTSDLKRQDCTGGSHTCKKPKRLWNQHLSSLFLHKQHFCTLFGATMETGKSKSSQHVPQVSWQHSHSHTLPTLHLQHLITDISSLALLEHLITDMRLSTLDHWHPVCTVHLEKLIWKQQGAPASQWSCVSSSASNIPVLPTLATGAI